MDRVFLAMIFSVDLALFVLVFLIVRLRRIRAEVMLAVIGFSVAAYLASLVLLIVVSSHL